MPLVSIYKCSHTGKFFEDVSKYRKHLQKLALQRKANRIHKVYKDQWSALLNELHALTTADSIATWIEDHSRDLYINACKCRVDQNIPDTVNKFRIKITKFDLRWDKNLSNSHCAPVGKQTNWGGRNPDYPYGFPGWRGHLGFGISCDTPSFSSDLFKGTLIHTGTGGSWHNFQQDGINYIGRHYDVTLWDDDWPGLKVHRALTQSE